MTFKSSIKLLITTSLLLLFVNCTFTNPIIPPQDSEHKEICLTGSYSITAPGTSLPRNYNGNIEDLSRSATAEIPAASSIEYFVKAETPNDTPGGKLTVNVPANDINLTNKTFSINLQTGYYWTITVGIKDKTIPDYPDGNNCIILSDSFGKNISATDTSIVHQFNLKPAITEGTNGSVDLYINFPSGMSLSITDEDNQYSEWNDRLMPESSTQQRLYISIIPSGIYVLKLKFQESGKKPYIATQTIVVYDNMKTNTWVSGGNGLITGSTFELTSTIYNASVNGQRNFYVDAAATNGDTQGTGESLSPFKTVEKAIGVINAMQDQTANYYIFAKAGGSESTNTRFTLQRNIDVIVYENGEGKGPANPSGSYTINFTFNGALFYVNKHFSITGLNLIGPDNTVVSIGVQLINGGTQFTLNSGEITKFSVGIVGGGTATTPPVINLYGGNIHDNGLHTTTTTGAGVELNYSTGATAPVLNVKGNPVVKDNKSMGVVKNISFISTLKGEKITFVGPLTAGCDLGISIRDLEGPGNTYARQISQGYMNTNASTPPSTYLHGDKYTLGQTSTTSELYLGQSGGSYELFDFDTITIQNAETSPGTIKMYELPLTFNFKIMKGTEEFNEALIVKDIIGPGGSSYFNDVFYSTNARTGGGLQVTIKEKALPSGYYKLQVGFTNNGAAYDYTQNFTVTDGYVQTPGAHYTGSPSFQKSVFVSQRDITIPALIVCQHEVTQAEFEEYCYFTSTPSTTAEQKKLTPAYNVNWYDAVIYCNLRSKAENLTPVYYLTDSEGNELTDGREISVWASTVPDNKVRNQNGKYYTAIYYNGFSRLDYKGNSDNDGGIYFDPTANGWRLPTEAEWEYLARGGNLSNNGYLYSGSEDADDVAWHNGNSDDKVHYICTKKPNALGIYDMSGNVREWCWDWQYATASLHTLTSPYGCSTGVERMVRGGSYGNTPSADSQLNCRNRAGYITPGNKESETGFRVVRNAQ